MGEICVLFRKQNKNRSRPARVPRAHPHPALRKRAARIAPPPLTVVHEDSPDKFTVLENVPTQRGARTMALDPGTHQVYLVTADFAPAPPTVSGQPRRRPTILPNTFVVLVLGQ